MWNLLKHVGSLSRVIPSSVTIAITKKLIDAGQWVSKLPLPSSLEVVNAAFKGLSYLNTAAKLADKSKKLVEKGNELTNEMKDEIIKLYNDYPRLMKTLFVVRKAFNRTIGFLSSKSFARGLTIAGTGILFTLASPPVAAAALGLTALSIGIALAFETNKARHLTQLENLKDTASELFKDAKDINIEETIKANGKLSFLDKREKLSNLNKFKRATWKTFRDHSLEFFASTIINFATLNFGGAAFALIGGLTSSADAIHDRKKADDHKRHLRHDTSEMITKAVLKDLKITDDMTHEDVKKEFNRIKAIKEAELEKESSKIKVNNWFKDLSKVLSKDFKIIEKEPDWEKEIRTRLENPKTEDVQLSAAENKTTPQEAKISKDTLSKAKEDIKKAWDTKPKDPNPRASSTKIAQHRK
jgi:hypothetical protein